MSLPSMFHALDRMVQENPFLSGLIVGAAGSSLSTWLIWSMKAVLHIPEVPTFGMILKSRGRKKTARLIRKHQQYVRTRLGGIAANYYMLLAHEHNQFSIDNSYDRRVLNRDLDDFMKEMSEFFLTFDSQSYLVQTQFLDELNMRQAAMQRRYALAGRNASISKGANNLSDKGEGKQN